MAAAVVTFCSCASSGLVADSSLRLPGFWPSMLHITGFMCLSDLSPSNVSSKDGPQPPDTASLGCFLMREHAVTFSATPSGLLLPTLPCSGGSGMMRYYVAGGGASGQGLTHVRVSEALDAGIGGSVFDSAIGVHIDRLNCC